MKFVANRQVRVVLVLILTFALGYGVVKGIERITRPSLCELNNKSLPSITNQGDVNEVAKALKQRADFLSKGYDTNSKEESEALKTLAKGFKRLALELEKADSSWTLDTLVSELANDSKLNAANLTLESALKQCK